MKTGAPLYTIKSYTQNVKDFACSMKKIAEMGYKTVQISAVGKDLKPEQIREICDANGLEIALTHSDSWMISRSQQKRLLHQESF